MLRRLVLPLALFVLSLHVTPPAGLAQEVAAGAASPTPPVETPEAEQREAEAPAEPAVTPAAAEAGVDNGSPAALPALDAAPSGEGSPDPLTPPEDKEPAPAAPGANTPAAVAPSAGASEAKGASPVSPLARTLPSAEAPVQETASPVVTQIRARLSERPAPSRNDDKEDLAGMKAFYGAGAGQSIWTGADGLNERGLKAIAEIRNAGEWGLDAKAFEAPDAPAGEVTPEALADAEIKLSVAVLKYARYARGGRINPPVLSRNFDRKPRIYDPKTVLQAVANAEASDAYLRGLHPKHEGFEQLRKVWLAGVKPAEPGADIKIPAGDTIKPGEQHPHVALVRQRLAVAEKPRDGKEDVYDDVLADKVKAFQKSHDLKPNGAIDRKLRAALNEAMGDTPDLKRMRILANMEKWRWMPDDLGDFYIWNSVPEQLTRVFEKDKLVLMEKIVVGKPNTPTPSFSANMQFVIFQPEWNVPDGIKTGELWPRLRQASGGGFFGGGNGSAVLRAYGLRAKLNGREVDADMIDWSSTDIRRYQFTQPPGGKNVLGVVKFRFPNKHDVYMHDTPERHLFSSGRRAFSHGCMRVQNPVRLAEVLLARDKGWSAARVRELAAQGGGGQDEIALSKPIPVHITYFTQTVDENGKLQSHPDVYDLDGRLIEALKGKPMDVSAAPTVAQAEGQQSAKPTSKRASGASRRRRDRDSFFWD